MFTIDASVHISSLSPAEEGSPESQAFLEHIHGYPWPVFSPTLLLVEVAAAIARVFDDAEQSLAIARAIRGLPGQVWIPLDETLAEEAIQLAAQCRVRGADAVYGAVARRYGATLVTWDQQQLKRLRPTLPTLTPVEALSRLREQHRRPH